MKWNTGDNWKDIDGTICKDVYDEEDNFLFAAKSYDAELIVALHNFEIERLKGEI